MAPAARAPRPTLRPLPFLLLAACGLALLAPAAAAESGFTLTLGDPTLGKSVLDPDVDVVKAVVPWTVACKGPASTPVGTVVPTAVVQLEAWVPDRGVAITGQTSLTTDLPDCLTRMSTEGQAEFYVTASASAAGDTPQAVHFNATLRHSLEEPVDADVAAAPKDANFRVAFLGLVTAQAAVTIQEGPVGSTLVYLLEVRNLGNAPAAVEVALDDAAPVRGHATLPGATLLPRDGQAVLRIEYTPQVAGQESFALRLTPHSLLNPSDVGHTIGVNLLARGTVGRGSGDADLKASPAAPLPAFIAGLLALAAAVAQRRR